MTPKVSADPDDELIRMDCPRWLHTSDRSKDYRHLMTDEEAYALMRALGQVLQDREIARRHRGEFNMTPAEQAEHTGRGSQNVPTVGEMWGKTRA